MCTLLFGFCLRSERKDTRQHVGFLLDLLGGDRGRLLLEGDTCFYLDNIVLVEKLHVGILRQESDAEIAGGFQLQDTGGHVSVAISPPSDVFFFLFGLISKIIDLHLQMNINKR